MIQHIFYYILKCKSLSFIGMQYLCLCIHDNIYFSTLKIVITHVLLIWKSRSNLLHVSFWKQLECVFYHISALLLQIYCLVFNFCFKIFYIILHVENMYDYHYTYYIKSYFDITYVVYFIVDGWIFLTQTLPNLHHKCFYFIGKIDHNVQIVPLYFLYCVLLQEFVSPRRRPEATIT